MKNKDKNKKLLVICIFMILFVNVRANELKQPKFIIDKSSLSSTNHHVFKSVNNKNVKYFHYRFSSPTSKIYNKKSEYPEIDHRLNETGEWIVMLELEFKDGSTSDIYKEKIKVQYLSTSPVAKILVGNDKIIANSKTLLSSSGSYDSDGGIISYDWYINDEKIGSGIEYEYVFNKPGKYRVKLVLKDDDGNESEKIENIVVLGNSAPIARLAVSKESIKVGEVLQLDASESKDPDGMQRLFYKWSFSDGQKRSRVNPKINFHKAGKVEIKLRVYEESGLNGEASKEIDVVGD